MFSAGTIERNRLLVTSSDLSSLMELGAFLQPGFGSLVLAHSPDPAARGLNVASVEADAVVIVLGPRDRWHRLRDSTSFNPPIVVVLDSGHPDRALIEDAGARIVDAADPLAVIEAVLTLAMNQQHKVKRPI